MTAGWRACSNCRRPPGCAAIACARSAASRRRRSTGLRAGITVEGVRYGPIEATLDREQGANVWLTFAIREGKNREVRKVLETLGLKVNRLIRVAFGPFQLGELAEGRGEGSRVAGAAHRARRKDRGRGRTPISRRRWSIMMPKALPRHPEGRQANAVDTPAGSRYRPGAASRAPQDDGSTTSATATTKRNPAAREISKRDFKSAATATAGGPAPDRRGEIMRVVGGRLRSRPIAGPKSDADCARPPTGCARRCSISSCMPTAIR